MNCGRWIRPVAYVVCQPGRNGGEAAEVDLREHVRSRPAHCECPREFHFVSELPRTATGKIQRFKPRQS